MTRFKKDLLGSIELPSEALYGANTARALRSFPPDRLRTVADYPELVDALLRIKWAAAAVNRRIGDLDEARAQAIIASARALLVDRSAADFPLCHLHGGGGTAVNMNVNEVLANCAEERLGGRRGEYRHVHPNDHVNLHQSTNDVYPTACHMAVMSAARPFADVLSELADTLDGLIRQVGNHGRLARTCLQDAVEVTYGDLFGSYAALVRRSRTRFRAAAAALHAVNLGGTIVGRTEDAPPAYRASIIEGLREVTGDAGYRAAENLFDAAQNPDDMVAVSSALDLLARSLIKISQDLRLLSSGPEAGLGEIRLPPIEAGSSIMPGKINPVIPESVIQCCFQVIGRHHACAEGLNHGELDLNIWESSMVFSVLDAMELLTHASRLLMDRCLSGLTVVAEANERGVDTIIPLLTRLMHAHGYSAISDVCRRAAGDVLRLRALLGERGFLPEVSDPPSPGDLGE